MANREVNLTKRVQTAQGLRYCCVVLSANGRVKPDVVVVSGNEERHPEGGPAQPKRVARSSVALVDSFSTSTRKFLHRISVPHAVSD
jgi:hypothetical protein